MNTPSYKPPPIVHAWVGHAVGTGLLGALLPSGEHLGWLHRLMLPIVEVIPNAMRITSRAPDPVFAQTFIGLSLLIALLILLYFVFFMRGYHTRTFDAAGRRYLVIAGGWLLTILMLSSFWIISYMNPLSKGRTYFLLQAATSGEVGVLTMMNQLVAGGPLLFLLAMWLAHACTTARNSASSF